MPQLETNAVSSVYMKVKKEKDTDGMIENIEPRDA